MAERPAWMDDPPRRAWVLNSLDGRISELRTWVRNMRRSYRNPHMVGPANWLADAYEAAVIELEARRDEIKGKP